MRPSPIPYVTACVISVLSAPAAAFDKRASALEKEALDALWQHDDARARALARRLRREFPRTPHAHSSAYVLAKIAEREGRFEDALGEYDRFLGSGRPGVYRPDAVHRSAILRRALRTDSTEAATLYLQALDARARGDFAKAVALLESLLERHAGSPLVGRATMLEAAIHLDDRDDYQAAQQEYKRLVRFSPHSGYADMALYGLGVARERAGDYEEAAGYFGALQAKHRAVLGMRRSLITNRKGAPSRLWFVRAQSRLELARSHGALEQAGERRLNKESLLLAIGGSARVADPPGTDRFHRLMTSLLEQHRVPAAHVAHWINRKTDWRWEKKQYLWATARAGYTPVVVLWYFGDEISPSFVSRHEEAYFAMLREELVPLISELPEVFVLIEPEFNKRGIPGWPRWDDVASQAISIVKRGAPGARVGLVVGDWGNFEVEDPIGSIERSAQGSDFVGFMHMLSAISHEGMIDPSWTFRERHQRVVWNLHQRFKKPLYLAYLAVSTVGDWEMHQAQVIRQLFDSARVGVPQGLIGMGFFALFDNPRQSGWFRNAEGHFGLLRVNGQRKPGADAWSEAARSLIRRDRVAPSLREAVHVRPSRGISFRRGRTAEIELNLDEWARWQLTIAGRTSRAIFRQWGAGSRVFVRWAGQAQTGRFDGEVCDLHVEAKDLAGNVLSRTLEPITIVEPLRLVTGMEARLGGSGIPPWRASDRVRRLDGGAIEIGFEPGVAGLHLPLVGLRRMRRALSDSFVELEVTLRAGHDSLSVGIQDDEGVRTDVPLAAYRVVDERTESRRQKMTIPFSDFPALGKRFTSGGRLGWRLFSWDKIKHLVLFKTDRAQVRATIHRARIQFAGVSGGR